jgi:hypothetical protein
MLAISMPRVRRTIIDRTTSSRASFFFTVLRTWSRGDEAMSVPSRVRHRRMRHDQHVAFIPKVSHLPHAMSWPHGEGAIAPSLRDSRRL